MTVTESINRLQTPKPPLTVASGQAKRLSTPQESGMAGDRFNPSNPHQAADTLKDRIVKIIGKAPNTTLSFVLRAGEELQDASARLAWYEAVVRDHDLAATDTDPAAARVMIGRLGNAFLDAPVGGARLNDARAMQFGLRALEAVEDNTRGLAQFAHDQAQRLRNPGEARSLIRDALIQLHELPDDASPVDGAMLAATLAVERIDGTTGNLSEHERAELGLAALGLVAETFKDPYLMSQYKLAKKERVVEERLAIVHEALMGAL
jgi:hypothetical protein